MEGSAKDRPDPFTKDRADRRDRPMAEKGLLGLVAHHAHDYNLPTTNVLVVGVCVGSK